jgi:hypothetical protein
LGLGYQLRRDRPLVHSALITGMDLAGKLQLKPGQTVSTVNAPPDATLHLDDVWSALRLRPA